MSRYFSKKEAHRKISILPVIREMQLKVRSHFTHNRTAIAKNRTTGVGKDVKTLEPS